MALGSTSLTVPSMAIASFATKLLLPLNLSPGRQSLAGCRGGVDHEQPARPNALVSRTRERTLYRTMSESKVLPQGAPRGESGEFVSDGRCVECGGLLETTEIFPRSDVAYVRRRVVVCCLACKRSRVFDRRRLVLCLALLFCAGSGVGDAPIFGGERISAQEAEQTGALEHRNVDDFPEVYWLNGSVRALGLGGAYQLGNPAGDALFYFPSVVLGTQGFGSQLQLWGSGASSASLWAATPAFSGTMAMGLITLGFTTNSLHSPLDQGTLFDSGTVGAHGYAALLGYARGLGPINMGASAKFAEERVTGSKLRVPVFDLGASGELGPLTLAASYQNLGSQELGLLPRRLRMGLGRYGLELGPFDLGFAAEISKARDWMPGAGVELGYWPVSGRTFVARAGVRRVVVGQASSFTLGFSYWGDDILLEWAFQPIDGVEGDRGTHRLAVGWR